MNTTTKPIVAISENFKTVYERKTWLIFSWYVKAKTDRIGNDLIINTQMPYDKIILNGKILN